MSLSSTSINRPVLSTVFAIVIVLFGIVGVTFLGIREYPSVDPAIISSLGIEQLKAINDFVLRSNRQQPYGFEKLTQFILQKDPSYFLGRTEWLINLMF